MGYFKLNTDGTIKSRSKQVDNTWRPLSELETYEDGSYATYYNEDGTIDTVKEQEISNAKALADWKDNRQKLVNSIEVEYNGVIYQGDEESQTRMDRTARGLEKKDILYPETAPHTIGWIAKDNSEVQLTADELTLIMIMAGEQQSAIWNEGRPS